MGRTACTEPQCLYKGALYLTSVPVQGCTLPYLSACTRVHFTFTSVPVQGCTLPYLSACTRVHFTFTSVPVQGCTLPYLSACTRVHFTFTSHEPIFLIISRRIFRRMRNVSDRCSRENQNTRFRFCNFLSRIVSYVR